MAVHAHMQCSVMSQLCMGLTEQLPLLYTTLLYGMTEHPLSCFFKYGLKAAVHTGCGTGRAVTAFSSMRRRCSLVRLRVKQVSLQ